MAQNIQNNTLFNLIYELPLTKQEIKNYQQLQNRIQSIIVALINQSKINKQEIQKVCKTNARLNLVARLLREHVPPEGVKQNNFSILISSIISMFTHMITSPKMIQYLNKLSIPFSLYRIILRIYCNCGKFQFLKKMEVQQSFKFIAKFLSEKSKNFPRLYASLILNILNEYSQKMAEKERKLQEQDLIVNKQNERMVESIKSIMNIAFQLIKNNLKLAAESGILVAMYRKAIDNDLNTTITVQLVEVIAQHMNNRDTRQIILGHLDLCRVFALFTNVDCRPREGKSEQKIARCAMMIEMLLSYCSTLFYFICERVTLKNFIVSLRSKSKSQKELSIINEKIFMKFIDKAMRYDRNKMQRSNNHFGLHSNYLNYRALLIISFFLDSTQIFETYLNYDHNGSLFAGLGKISLMYFPITFEKGKYNKQIIQTIKLPSVSDYEKLSRDFLNILSYYDYCIIPYEFSKGQLISYLLQIKSMEYYQEEFHQQNRKAIQDLLSRAKQSHSQNFDQLLLDFYTEIMKICEILPWKPQYLKLAKFLSVIIDYLRTRDYHSIVNASLNVVTNIFTNPKSNQYRYLYITALDDAGKYFQDHQRVQQLILSHYRNYEYAFRISRILLHVDLGRRQAIGSQSHKKILQIICCQGGCQELVLQAIEIIRFYCIDNDDKADWGAQIICQRLIYHQSEEIACAAVEFCQEFVINHRNHKNYLYKTNLQNIKNNNLRKRIMYLLMNSEKGMEILNNYNPNFIKDELDLWLNQGNNRIKQFSIFLNKESRKFTANKQASFLDIGNISQNRHKLIFLPWNISINGKNYVGLASYKYLKQKINLRVSPQLLVENKIEISTIQIGGFPMPSGDNKNSIVVKREEIIKNYQRNKIKDNKELKQFAVSKEKMTFSFKYNAGCLVLEKILIDVPLARDVYRSLTYPLNFITLLTKTGKGFNYLREYKFIQECVKFCRYREDKEEKDFDVELCKGAIQCLGMLFACWKLELLERIQIFSVVHDIFEKTTNLQLKEVALWTLNIIVKDDDLRRKLKQSRGWLMLESKYSGWLCYPQFYNQLEMSEKQISQFGHINSLLPQRINNEGYRLILSVLELSDKTDKDIFAQKVKKKEMIQFFKKPENKEHAWDPKLLERVVMYVSTVNFGLERTRQVLDMFTDYFLSEKFDADFLYGSSLP